MSNLIDLLENFQDKFKYTGPYSSQYKCVDTLSRNPNITWNYISKNLDKKWNYYYLTKNQIVTLEIIKAFPKLTWDFDVLFENPNITFDIILENKMLYDKLNENNNKDMYMNMYMRMYHLCRNVNITPEIVANNPHFNWNYKSLSWNHNMTSEFILQNLDKDWNYDALSSNPYMDKKILDVTGDKKWNYSKIIRFNPEGVSIVFDNLDEWETLSCSEYITQKLILDNLDKNWDWYWLSRNKAVTWDMVCMFPELPWDWLGLSFNENITWDIVKANPYKNWQYRGLSLNPNITPDIILENKELDWDFYNLSTNTFTKSDNINKKIIKNNREKRRMINRTIIRILKIDNRLYNDLIGIINSVI